MSRFAQRAASPRRTGDGVDVNLVFRREEFDHGKQRQLYRGGEAARIGDVPRLGYLLGTQFGQPIDEPSSRVVGRIDAEVGAEIDDPRFGADGIFGEKLARDTVSETQEQKIDGFEFVGEAQVCVAGEVGVHRGDRRTRIRRAEDEFRFGSRVIDEDSQQFSGGVARAADYSDTRFSLPVLHAFSKKFVQR